MTEQQIKASHTIVGGNSADGIGCNAHNFRSENGENATNVLVDFGIKMEGKRIRIPDNSFLDEADAIVLTHAHADHIQGVVEMVKAGKYRFTKNGKHVPVIGSAHTVLYLQAELRKAQVSGDIIDNMFTVAYDAKDHEIAVPEEINDTFLYSWEKGSDGKERLKTYVGKEGSMVTVSMFDIAHSTKGSSAVGIEMENDNKLSRVMHFGDCRADDPQNPVTDYAGIDDFLKNGVDTVLLDSTSVDKPEPEVKYHETDVRNDVAEKVTGVLSSNGEIKDVVFPVIARSDERMESSILGTLDAYVKNGLINSSDNTVNIYIHGGAETTHRVLDDAAAISDSPQYKRIVECAKERGINLKFHSGREYSGVPENKVRSSEIPNIHVCTGVFGDDLAQEMQAAVSGSTQTIPCDKKTAYIFSQRSIPVDDIPKRVEFMEALLRSKAAVAVDALHVSGHNTAGDTRSILSNVKEKSPNTPTVVPVHGSDKQREIMAELAKGVGLKSDVVGNGDTTVFDKDGIHHENSGDTVSIIKINGGIKDANAINKYGKDIIDAFHHRTVEEYCEVERHGFCKAENIVSINKKGDVKSRTKFVPLESYIVETIKDGVVTQEVLFDADEKCKPGTVIELDKISPVIKDIPDLGKREQSKKQTGKNCKKGHHTAEDEITKKYNDRRNKDKCKRRNYRGGHTR